MISSCFIQQLFYFHSGQITVKKCFCHYKNGKPLYHLSIPASYRQTLCTFVVRPIGDHMTSQSLFSHISSAYVCFFPVPFPYSCCWLNADSTIRIARACETYGLSGAKFEHKQKKKPGKNKTLMILADTDRRGRTAKINVCIRGTAATTVERWRRQCGGDDRFLYLVAVVRESAVMQNEPWRVLHTIFAGPWTLVDQNKDRGKNIRGFSGGC